MMGPLSHHEVEELLGAYALDAVDPEEAVEVEAHLVDCPRCQAELAEHREVAGLFAYAGQAAPDGLWDRITASMQEVPPELRMDRIRPSMVTAESHRSARADLDRAGPERPGTDRSGADRSGADRPGHERPGPEPDADGVEPARIVSLDQRRARSDRRRIGLRALVASAAAAAAVAAVIGVSVADNQHHTSPSAVIVSSPKATMSDVRQALAEKGSRKVVLRPLVGNGATLDAVVTPSGNSYLYDSQLTPLGADRTYQLWGVVGNQRISYRLLGTDPDGVLSFGSGTGLEALVVTDEVASGVAVSHQPVVAMGQVTPAL